MYMDPEPTVSLNNREAMLSGQEEEEEARILAALSSAVAARSARIWQVRPVLALKFLCAPVLHMNNTSRYGRKLTHSAVLHILLPHKY